MNSEKNNKMINHLKDLLKPTTNWALFENGTFVIIQDANNEEELNKKAIEYVKKFGPVHIGSEAGDFSVTEITEWKGWIVEGHAENMYTVVYPEELEGQNNIDFLVGMCGRAKRDKDSQECKIIHKNIKE